MNKHEIRLLIEQAEIENWVEIESLQEEPLYSTALGAWQDQQGYNHLQAGAYTEAEQMFKRSIKTYKKCYDDLYETPPEIYNPSIHLAECCVRTGRLKKAIKAYLKALDISKLFREFDYDNNYWHLELDIYINIGKLYVELGEQEMALYYHERAVEYLVHGQ